MSQISYGALVNAVKNLEREIYKGRSKYALPTENSIRIDMLVREMASLLEQIGGKKIKEITQALNGPGQEDNIASFNENGVSTLGDDNVRKFDSLIKALEYAIQLLGSSKKSDDNPAIIKLDDDEDPEKKLNYYDIIHTLQQIYDDVKNIEGTLDVVINPNFNIFKTYHPTN